MQPSPQQPLGTWRPAIAAPPAELVRVAACTYLLPLREGGSLPGLMEADDLGTYVVKFTGAGQGRRALVADVVVSELARALGLPVPAQVLIEVDFALAAGEPDEEVQDLLRASAGINLGIDYLPGSLGFDPAAHQVDPDLAGAVIWLDALTLNVDRSWRNPNLLRYGRKPWLIDHGAALFVHHSWTGPGWLRGSTAARRELPGAADHALLRLAGSLTVAHERLGTLISPQMLAQVIALVPDEWLVQDGFENPDQLREAYVELLTERLAGASHWLAPLEQLRADKHRD